MARTVDGYVVITDQGDSAAKRPLLYARVRFPGANRVIIEDHIKQTTDIYECTVFNPQNPIHIAALAVLGKKFPKAVPVRVVLTRNIDVIAEIPSETSDQPPKWARIQLPEPE